VITTPSVLVLGAGASAWAGFPVGVNLRTDILAALISSDNRFQRSLLEVGFTQTLIEEFHESFRQSGQTSVDAFLEHRDDLREVGKAAIAYQLIGHETPGRLFDRDMDWYAHLYKRMNCAFQDFGKNDLSIVTFNYDRSIEHFLFTALKNTHRKDDREVAERLAEIPIIHVHGRLGRLPWQGPGGRTYAPSPTPNDIRIAAAGIRIVHDQVSQDEAFSQARDLMKKAQRVVFLGFGYDEINVSRLIPKLSDVPGTLFGSAFELAETEIVSLRQRFENRLHTGRHGARVLEFLRERVAL